MCTHRGVDVSEATITPGSGLMAVCRTLVLKGDACPVDTSSRRCQLSPVTHQKAKEREEGDGWLALSSLEASASPSSSL